ncbi:hypothetical protein GCM10027445_07160 [Amycolatopsis endophytica]|uniref:Uncharacterized protein n=1 Tax=Amycolatopsis endophytica TaxID=860233 RepID=A0A853AWD4_9PSEU|nr:hypothetical protein [Amycolatopsis endophytica]NYI86955.1 hypothetical protein [Amycolatopsis endophytica]
MPVAASCLIHLPLGAHVLASTRTIRGAVNMSENEIKARPARTKWWLGGAGVVLVAVIAVLLVYLLDDGPGDFADDVASALTGGDRAAYEALQCGFPPAGEKVNLPDQGYVSAFDIGPISVYEVQHGSDDYAVALFVADSTPSFIVGQMVKDGDWCLQGLFACPVPASASSPSGRDVDNWARERLCAGALGRARG